MNVIPKDAFLSGTVRTFSPVIQKQVISRMEEIIAGIASAFNASITMKYHKLSPATVNPPDHAALVAEVAAELFGRENFVATQLGGAPLREEGCQNARTAVVAGSLQQQKKK